MAYNRTPGENSMHVWRKMDAPERVGTCKKLREGQLLMQRYKFVFAKGNNTIYQSQADRCKERSIILAERMVAHAQVCNRCCEEQVLADPVFYGVYK